MRWFAILLLGLLMVVPTHVSARAVALVIGNDTYDKLPSLSVAVSDAKAHCKHLKEVRNFDEVLCHYNTTKAEMDQVFFDFLTKLKPDDTAMLVYAGHGVQLDRNDPSTVFLIPTDLDKSRIVQGTEEWAMRRFATQFDELRRAISAQQVRLSIFVLDNCRDNPLFDKSNTRSLSLAAGLGSVPADRGEFIFFSASEGQVSIDKLREGDTNSPFTTAFLDAFSPNVPLVSVANTVEREVSELTRRLRKTVQTPRYDDNVEGPGCIEGPNECSAENRVSKVDLQIEEALASKEYGKLLAVLDRSAQHSRAAEVKAALALHREIDAQQTRLNLDELKVIFSKMYRHPRREEVRALIRRAILFNSCIELQRFGWSCPPMPQVTTSAQQTPPKTAALETSSLSKPDTGAGVTVVTPSNDTGTATRQKTAPDLDTTTRTESAVNADRTPADKPVVGAEQYAKFEEGIIVESLGDYKLPLKNLQEALKALDYLKGVPDGVYGPQTAAAIEEWRAMVGSPHNGRDLVGTEPLVLLQQAAEKSPSSMALLGLFHAQGLGFEKDAEVGRDLLRRAGQNGFRDASVWLKQLENL